MERKGIQSALKNLNEYFASVWTLMSDTTIFLSNNTKILYQYESQLRELRHRLERNRKNSEVLQEVRQELVIIRKALRMQGYNLRLGSLDLRLEGFRNDEALSDGFSRCVLFLLEDGDIIYITGTSNHIELDDALERRQAAKGYRPVIGKHFLWFKWENRVLILSGAASETKDDFDEFREYVAENKSTILRRLSKMGG
jgi:hypothetical protein